MFTATQGSAAMLQLPWSFVPNVTRDFRRHGPVWTHRHACQQRRHLARRRVEAMARAAHLVQEPEHRARVP